MFVCDNGADEVVMLSTWNGLASWVAIVRVERVSWAPKFCDGGTFKLGARVVADIDLRERYRLGL